MILSNVNKEKSKKILHSIIDTSLDFKTYEKVFQKKNSKEKFDNPLPLQETDLLEIIDQFNKKVLPYSNNFSTTNFLGFPDAGNSVAAMVGAVYAELLQQNLINQSFCGKIATFIEIETIKWLREIAGYKTTEKIEKIEDVGGIITNGGTMSNCIALLLARENHKKNTFNIGITNPDDYKILVPKEIGHYSIRCSQQWLGCGQNIVEVETENYRYNLNDLKNKLKKYKNKIMAVVTYAGDSRTMTIEKLEEVYKIVKESDENIWLHVDACHGFSLAFSKKHRERIEGIKLYDSIAIDPHKVLMCPYTVSALLLKNPEKFATILTSSDLITQEKFSFGKITPFIGSKNWNSLKLWFLIKNLGVLKIGVSDKKKRQFWHFNMINSKIK